MADPSPLQRRSGAVAQRRPWTQINDGALPRRYERGMIWPRAW